MRRDRGRKPRRKVCVFCADHIDQIDYKDVAKLRRFTTERGNFRYLRKTSTQIDYIYQTCTCNRFIAIHCRIIDESRRYNHLVVPPFCYIKSWFCMDWLFFLDCGMFCRNTVFL